MIEATDAHAAAGVGLGLVLQGGPLFSGRPVPLSFPVQLQFVAVWVAEHDR